MDDRRSPNLPPQLRDAREVWEFFVAEGGLEPDGWDAPLVEELSARLGLGADPVVDELLARDVTTEALVYALLGALEPFAAMMGDLLALFERHGIKRSDGSAEIVFDFEAPGRAPLHFDLDAFRRTRREWALATAPGVDPNWLHTHAWALRRVLIDALGAHDWQQPRPETEGWISTYWEGEWPETPLAVPPSRSPALDAELARVARIWASVVGAIRARAANREELRPRDRAVDDPMLEVLAWVESDYFLLQLASAVLAATNADERSRDPDELAAELRAFLDEHPFAGEPVEQLVQRLLDVLELPIWKQRHELYSAWVLAELLATVPATVRIIPTEPGVLRFPFSASPMAELLGCDHSLVVWSELRTPLSDPIGVSRKGSVQPDYSVVADAPDPRSNPAASVLEIECKQYKRSDTRGFAAALRDYAAARLNALVVLVSHGPLSRERLRRAVPRDLRDRTEAIERLHPLNQQARERFHELVDDRLAPLCPRPVLLWRLEWDRAPRDLDLHLFVKDKDGTHEVCFSEPGALDRPPFEQLAEDIQQPGAAEELTVDRWLDGATYALAVHAYSDDGKLAGSDARVTLERRGRPPLQLECPTDGDGRWWLVAEVGAKLDVRIRGELCDDPPWVASLSPDNDTSAE
jgi:hypothetical protein